MKGRLAGRTLAFSLFACLVALFLCVSIAGAQSSATGAITGTITDPSGATAPNVTVTATSTATNQVRTATTGPDGVYKFSLLPPGTYRLKFSAASFKTAEVSAVTVVVTETSSVNQVLEVGAVTQTVTVESQVETLQTETSALGNTVSSSQISALPMANGNYTEILALSGGATPVSGNNAAIGKGTLDMSVNGNDPGQNNFQMDGVAVNNIANSGSSNDGTIYTGIPIPSPDALAEFKVQTSTFDASYGRNPGANVNVVTKSGTNTFHGSAFEIFRNTALNANDFFFKASQVAAGAANKPPAYDSNQFGATVGGPIKKDKLFFFFSYRGTRAKNGLAPQGQDFGAHFISPFAPPINSESRGTCPAATTAPDLSSILATCDAAAEKFATDMGIADTNIVGLRIFQLQGGVKTSDGSPSYYIPNVNSVKQFCIPTTFSNPALRGVCNFDIPAIYTENQYVANGDWIINSKHTLTTKYFYSHNPWTSFLGQAGGNLAGTPENILFGNHNAVAKLTSLLTSNFVNEARVSFQQNVNAATVTMPPGGSPAQLGMKPLVQGFFEPFTLLNVGTGYGMFGGLLPDKGPTNQLQVAEQISWSHGRHSIRAGFENEWTNWPLSDQGLQQGLMVSFGYGSFLGSGGPGWNLGCLFCVKGTSGQGIIHFYQLSNRNAYVLDDWKVNSRLTLNIGLRWEFDGLLSDKYGHLTQVWLNRLVPNSAVPTCLGVAPDPCGVGVMTGALPGNPNGVQQYVVPSNFVSNLGQPPPGVLISNNRNSVEGHAPYSNFAPRIGFAWQPLRGRKLVLRGGVGIFYDRVGEDRVVHAFEQGYPYAATYDFGFLSPRWFASTLANPYPQIQLVCMPKDPNCNNEALGLGFAARWADPSKNLTSGLNTPYDPVNVHTPLIREYSLGFQYELVHGWVLDLGYVGSSGINLTDYNHNHNGAQLFSPTNDPYGFCSGANAGKPCNTSGNVDFRVPYVGYEAIGLQASDFDGYSNYNSLQATVRHQFSHGLSFQAAYTWDKNLSDIFYGNAADINNALCVKCQYGRVSFDHPQRFVVNYSYDLPLGKSEGALGRLRSGWNVSGVTVVQSGDPLTFIDPGIPGPGGTIGAGSAYGTSTGLSFQGVSTAQFCAGMGNGNVLGSGSVLSRVIGGQYFNPKAFSTFTCKPNPVANGDPTALDYGNSGVGIVLGPGTFNWDIAIKKTTKITEDVSMQFTSSFYNAFNHPQFADPGPTGFGTVGFENITAPTYGQILHTSQTPRIIQFGLRFVF